MEDNYTKLLKTDPSWLIGFLTDMVMENDDRFEEALKSKDRDYVNDIIGRHIY